MDERTGQTDGTRQRRRDRQRQRQRQVRKVRHRSHNKIDRLARRQKPKINEAAIVSSMLEGILRAQVHICVVRIGPWLLLLQFVVTTHPNTRLLQTLLYYRTQCRI